MDSNYDSLSLCQRLRKSKGLAVGVVWATTSLSYMLFGALVPLLPKYVEDQNDVVEVEGSGLHDHTNTSNNITTIQCHGVPTQLQTPSAADSRVIGVLIATQKLTQIFISPLVGPLIDKIGYDVPYFVGFAVTIATALGFAFVKAIPVLFVLRGLHGVGNAILDTGGLTIVSDLYKDDDEKRGVMIGNAMCGITVGLALGPPFGSIMFEIGNTVAPFVTIAALLLCVALLQLYIRVPRIKRPEVAPNAKSSWEGHFLLIKDPYLLSCALLLVLGLIGVAFLETTLPLHMLHSMCPEEWMLGVAFMPINIGNAIGTPILGWMSRRYGRWNVSFATFILSAGALLAYAFCKNFVAVLMPGVPFGIALAAKNTAILPMMAYLVDVRIGESVYGSAYALADIGVAGAIGFGPIIAGFLTPVIGFGGIMYLASALSLVAVVPMAFLYKPLSTKATKEERARILENGHAKKEEKSLLSPE